MIIYDILRPIIDNTLHLSLSHITKDDVNVLKSTVFHGTAGLEVCELKNGFLVTIPDSLTDMDVVHENVSRGLYTILTTCININIKYLILSTEGHDIDIFSKYV